MSSSIDERIVEMNFSGSSFISGVKNALTALASLKSGLNGLKGSESDINNLDAAGKKFSLSGMANGLDSVKSKFSSLSVIGISALASITGRAVDAGISLVKSLTVDPIKDGLESYETKINAIQTILANTSAAGTTLSQVTTALNTLNTYANLTVYNFGQMAKNIGVFTAAGVGLQTAVSSIKGIANLAALSGASADQASNAMTQLSQAIAAGKVKLQDWNSVVNAGLGGKVFQTAILQTAKVNGVAVDAMLKKYGSFRNALQSGFLTSKILTESLSLFTGDLTTKQLEAMGFTAQESAAIQKQAALAVNAATQVRTISALFQDLKEEVATAFAAVFQALIGNIGQATTTLSALHNVAEAALTKPIYDLARILQAFTDLGGRAIVISAVEVAFKDLAAVLNVVKVAFDDVFGSSGAAGPGAANRLVALAGDMLKLSEALTPSKATLAELKTIFEGLFSAVKIVIDVFGDLIKGLEQIGPAAGGAVAGNGGGFLKLLSVIASWITDARKAIESGTALATFFTTLGKIIALPVKAIGLIVGALGGFGGAATKATGDASNFIDKIGAAFSKLGDAIVKGIQSGNIQNVVNIIDQVLLGGILVSIKKFIAGLGEKSEGGGLFATIKESFESLTTTLKTMQSALKSEVLEKIAIAVALLAASLVAMSFINVANLTKALTAVTILFTEMLTALSVVTKVSGSTGIVKMVAIGVALNLLAGAILVLAGAVAIFAQFSWSQLTKGLSAIAIILAELVGATLLLGSDSKGLIASALAMQIMATAITALALAVGILGKMKLDSLAKGIVSIAALLALLTAFSNFSGDTLISTATSLLIIGAALVVISEAVAKLGSLSLSSLAKGIAGIAAVLLILVVAMNAMDGALPGAAALLVASAALLILSSALSNLGSESWASIGKALVLLAGSLVIIAAAMILMTEALPGAAALLVVSAALAILSPVLIALGSLSWDAIAKGLAALAGVFLIIAAAGLLLTPLIPTLIGLGIAVGLLGVGVLAAGVGIGLLAVGITALAVAVAASGAAILSFVKSILSLIPTVFSEIGLGIVSFAKAISGGASAITNAFVVIFTAILNGIIKVTPLASKAFTELLTAFLTAINNDSPKIVTTFLNMLLLVANKIATYYPKFVTAGINLIVNLVNGVAKEVTKFASAATNLIVAFINAIGTSTVKVVNAGLKMVTNLINGIANAIKKNQPALDAAAANLGSAIVTGLIKGITAGLSGVINAAVNLAKSALNAAKNALKSASPSKEFIKVGESTGDGMAIGIVNNVGKVVSSAETMGTAAVNAIGNTLKGLNSIVSDNLTLQPTITPVIDLTQAKKGFNDLNSLTKNQLINAGASTSSAASISAANAAAAAQAGLLGTAGGTSLIFNQTNNSPVALSAVDIYRRTKNQISIARGALTGSAIPS